MNKKEKNKYKEFIITIIAVMGTQALLYFLIKASVSNYNIISTKANFPFIKEFIYIYNSWYPFILLSAFIVYKYDKKIYFNLIFTMLIAGLISHITFIIYPTLIVRPAVEVKNFTDLVLNFTYKMDSPAVNCMPSIHCIYCFITSFYICISKNIKNKIKIAFILYSILIVFSTLFTYQHIIEDVLLSLIYTSVCIVVILLNKKLINNIVKRLFN